MPSFLPKPNAVFLNGHTIKSPDGQTPDLFGYGYSSRSCPANERAYRKNNFKIFCIRIRSAGVVSQIHNQVMNLGFLQLTEYFFNQWPEMLVSFLGSSNGK